MQLKIISSNIRYDNPEDGEHSWENRKPLLLKIFHDFNPDILGTQEGRELQIKNLARSLSLKLVDRHRQWIQERMYPCLFINEDKIQVHKSGDIWLSETPEISGSKSFKSSFPRLCTWMHITHIKSHQDYFVINTHLDHVLEETRIQQVNVLINEIQKMNKLQLPIILLGDFNDSPKGAIRKTLIERLNLFDPWIKLGQPEETSHHGFRGSNETGDRIDWILIPHSFVIEEIQLEKRSFNDVFPSDHYPLLATVIPK
jgi:endonuclease/exonuclease/phosphatase family metal-dependent hydrolase